MQEERTLARFTCLFGAILVGCGGVTTVPQQPTEERPTEIGEAVRVSPLSVGVHQGSFTESDEQEDDGAYVHRFAAELNPGQRYRITMESEEVDSMLRLTGPGEISLRNDDAFPGTLDSILDFEPAVAGRYELVVTTIGRATGDYRLEVTESPVDGAGEAVDFEAGNARMLAGPDGPGLIVDWLHFEGEAGSRVNLRVTSQAFDTVVTVFGPGGQMWMNDDGNETGPNGDERGVDSTLMVSLPQSGVYQVAVTPYGQSGGGDYRVRATVRPAVRIPEGGGAPEALAGVEGQGRILGLFAGITDYEGDRGDLYGCADDASLLAQAFRDAHLQNPDQQTVLRDAEVTTEAFMRGIDALAGAARPDDVVVVFYSGHGSQQAVTEDDGVELDGMDETIALHNGSLTDNQVVAALSRIEANTVILALDSCHAGGFADDWARAEGQIGLYASHEDVLSNTAEPRRAGGYLSFHLREAVRGLGDFRPRDGVMNAGELSDYLYVGFLEDQLNMSPPGSMDPMQRLVVRRAGVPYVQPLWVYPRDASLQVPAASEESLMSAPPN